MELLTPTQVAHHLRVTDYTVYGWLRRGRLRGVKFGRRWRVAKGDLDAFVENHRWAELDEPLSLEEVAESDAAWRAFRAGEDQGELLSTVRATLLRGHRVGV